MSEQFPGGLLLAADGGNSKTDVAVIAADGTLLGRARGLGFRPQVVGMDAAMEVLSGLRTQALDAAGLSPRTTADGIAAFLAGADLPAEVRELRRAVAARGWATAQHVDNDTFAVLRAGASRPWGVAVVCGTGINCVGVAPDGRTSGFPALGKISGDWGGGSDLGAAALWHAARDENGRGPRTTLRAAVTAHFGLDTVTDVALALRRGQLAELRLSELCPAVFTCCDQGDPTAAALVDRLGDEVAGMALSVLRRLGLDRQDVEVVLGGSILAARHERLLTRVASRLLAGAPSARPLVSTAPPLLGAALAALALRPSSTANAATTRAAEARLRAGIR